MCVGRYDLITSIHEPCPHRSTVGDTETHCFDCERAIGFAPAFYNLPMERISEQQKQYNKLPHVVYLAWFGPSILKVGISSKERRYDRWLEQGAIGAVVLFQTADAYVARKLEETVSTQFRFREIVRSPDKFRSLYPEPDLKLCADELNTARWQIAQNIGTKVDQDEVFYGIRHYVENAFPNQEPIDLSNVRPLSISGVGYGVVGNFLLVRQDNCFFCVRLKTLLAHIVNISNLAIPNSGGQTQRRLL